ncbi:hypothetical protein RND81_12G075100 [Saponaria officinalis]|uniref:RRM domain-containing protein n=1 Tax=Saponaria officinalis TaxID=3572 RepID=A0AAW1H7Q3_SAPOF
MMERRMMSNNSNINAVFYAEAYHPIQAGSIDGTDILPHDNAVYRALLCSSAGLYDPFGDPKVTGDPYCTLFVGHLSRSTTENTLAKEMSKYGKVKNLRLVRDIVTGASRGYAFVEFETDREMRHAYEDAHHSYIDDSEIIVDYNRQQLMSGWIPRRLGGGLGGKKESGQLRFGGRERPFRAPLRPIPYEDLKRLGIPPPPEGRYMSRFQVPPPPRRQRNSEEREKSPSRRRRKSEERETTPLTRRRDYEDREMTPTKRKKNIDDRGISSPKRERDHKERESSSRKRKSDTGRDRYSRKHENERRHSHHHGSRSSGRHDSSD